MLSILPLLTTSSCLHSVQKCWKKLDHHIARRFIQYIFYCRLTKEWAARHGNRMSITQRCTSNSHSKIDRSTRMSTWRWCCNYNASLNRETKMEHLDMQLISTTGAESLACSDNTRPGWHSVQEKGWIPSLLVALAWKTKLLRKYAPSIVRCVQHNLHDLWVRNAFNCVSKAPTRLRIQPIYAEGQS